MRRIETAVLVVGAGPVGLCLAMDLAWRGTSCMLVEQRTERIDHPKATLLGARSMEQLRRWNLEEQIYAASLPNDQPYRISFATGMNGHELLSFESPSINDVRALTRTQQKKWPELNWSPYGKTQIGQQAMEPILFEHAKRIDGLEIREGWKLDHFKHDEEGVLAQLSQVGTGELLEVRCKYLVGADGGASQVRRILGIKFVGRGPIRPNVTFQFRSAEFSKSHQLRPGNLFYIMLPDTFGVFMNIDGKERWGYQYYFLDASKKVDQPDVAAILHRAVGKPFDFELLNVTHWQHHQSVAERFSAGRVFLAGDAAHLFSPTGGVGMNTGINDAFDLSWKLHATLRGWGGDWLLHSYEQERRPISIRNTQRAATNSDKNDMIMAEITPDVVSNTARGELLRAEISQKLRWVVGQYDSAGVHLGYRYQKSNICWPDAELEPPDDYRVVIQSTFPGMRAPHVWLEDGRSTLDLFGQDFVLLHFPGHEAQAASIEPAFASRGVPLKTVCLHEPHVQSIYGYPLVLVRPDGHVAWRGAEAPTDMLAVVDRVRGAIRPPFVPDWASATDMANLHVPP